MMKLSRLGRKQAIKIFIRNNRGVLRLFKANGTGGGDTQAVQTSKSPPVSTVSRPRELCTFWSILGVLASTLFTTSVVEMHRVCISDSLQVKRFSNFLNPKNETIPPIPQKCPKKLGLRPYIKPNHSHHKTNVSKNSPPPETILTARL